MNGLIHHFEIQF